MAALIPGINIVKVLLIGLGILKDEAAVKSMSRDGDYRFNYFAQHIYATIPVRVYQTNRN